MNVQKLKGNVSEAYLHVYLSRNGQNEGVDGLSVYAAPLLPDGQINAALEWKRFKFLDATWRGICGRRNLSGSSHLLSESSETVEGLYIMDAVPFAEGDDGCSIYSDDIDLLKLINGDGLAIGFFPSNPGYHLKAVLEYDGELEVSSF